MTKILEQAFAEFSKPPETEQDAIGGWLLGELVWERRWEKLFLESSGRLDNLASHALAGHHRSACQFNFALKENRRMLSILFVGEKCRSQKANFSASRRDSITNLASSSSKTTGGNMSRYIPMEQPL